IVARSKKMRGSLVVHFPSAGQVTPEQSAAAAHGVRTDAQKMSAVVLMTPSSTPARGEGRTSPLVKKKYCWGPMAPKQWGGANVKPFAPKDSPVNLSGVV